MTFFNNIFSFLNNQFRQIKVGRYKVFLRKVNSLIDRILLIISGVWAIPCVLLIRLFRGIILFRLGTLRSDRIGHFAADSGQQFVANSLNSKRTLDIYWLSKYISNKQLELMVRRNFLVFNFVRYLDYWNKLLPGGGRHIRPSSTSGSRDMLGILNKSEGNMNFLSSEDKEAKDWMSSYGWKEGDPFVCILVRDSAYLKNNDFFKNDYDYSYHGYRDSNIENYIEAMEWLANQGIWVFRMGRQMHKPVPISHPKIIDYAFCENQSDLLDIWMFANCNLCISTGSGPDMVSDIYRRPLLFVNYIPIYNSISWSNVIHLPKHLIYRKTGKSLTLSEHIKHSYFTSQQYLSAGIALVELSSSEILQAVQERFKNVFEESSVQNNKENIIFWKIILQSDGASERHGFIHKGSGVADSFLKNNINWLK